MTRILKRSALTAAIIAISIAVMPTSAAGNTAVQPMAENCDHYSGGGSGAIVPGGARYVQLNGTGTAIGSAQLCRQGNLFWGYVVFYSTMPAGKWGNAVLEIDRSGMGGPISRWSCDSPVGNYQPPNGANRFVAPGQTRCWTPKISADFSVDWLRVVGYRANNPHPGGTWDAWGYGAWK